MTLASTKERIITIPPEPFPPVWAEGWGEDRYGLYAEFDLARVNHRMRWIEPGTFVMGDNEKGVYDQSKHDVTLTKGFWLAETACTQEAWMALMGDNPSEFKSERHETLPVENVSWDDCQGFIKQANGLLLCAEIRLPTESEWEYACRAGTTTPFWFGNDITGEQVNYWGKTRKTVDVESFRCNSWGLYQMHGNVWEWCHDWLGDYPKGPVEDPSGPEEGASRVLRGGGWSGDARNCRSACRFGFRPPVVAVTASASVSPEISRCAPAGRQAPKQSRSWSSGADRESTAQERPCGTGTQLVFSPTPAKITISLTPPVTLLK